MSACQIGVSEKGGHEGPQRTCRDHSRLVGVLLRDYEAKFQKLPNGTTLVFSAKLLERTFARSTAGFTV